MKIKLLFTLFLMLFTFFACSTKDLYDPEKEKEEEEEKEKLDGTLTSFKFEKIYNPQLEQDITMTIHKNGNISGYLTHEVDLTTLKPSFKTENGSLYVQSQEQGSGKNSHNFSSTVTYNFTGDSGKKRTYKVNLLPYTGLPVISVNTVNEKPITTNKIDWIRAHISIDGMGHFDNFSDSTSVRGRGNSTLLRFPKKPFNMKLDNKSPILGMPKHKRWVFLANWRDRSLLRNDAALYVGTLADNMPWTSKSEFAEVLFNGEHMGNFQITEHIRVDKNRVNVKEMESSDIDAESITGGYLLEADLYYEENVNHFRSKHFNLPIGIKDPDEDVLVQEQKEYIINYINTIENALIAKNFEEVYKYIDIDSFIDYMIAVSLTGNTETGMHPCNVFFYKDRGKKLFAGPIWDFDSSAATIEKHHPDTKKTTLLFNALWYSSLMKDPYFVNKVKARYAVLKPRYMSTLSQHIKEKGLYFSLSDKLNWKMWKIDTGLIDGYFNGDETFEDYQDAVERLAEIYIGRLELLETEISKL